MSITVTTENPLAADHARLLERLKLIVPPNAAPIFAGPGWFEAARDYLRELAEVIDDHVAAIGFQISDNAPYNVDANSFNAVMSGAVADAAYECERMADLLRDDREAA